MFKTLSLGLLALLLLGAAYLWFNGGSELYRLAEATSTATVLDDYALQDDSRVEVPPLVRPQLQAYNPLKNVYWGELHIHTRESFDAALFGTTLTIEDAYRFARGAPLRSDGGELMQLSRPLDFLAITDHAESFGLRTRCGEEGLTLGDRILLELQEVKPTRSAKKIVVSGYKSAITPDGPASFVSVFTIISRSSPPYPLLSSSSLLLLLLLSLL